MTLFGTIGLFVTLMFLFVRVLPMISIFEMRTLLPEATTEARSGRRVALMAPRHDATPPFYGLMAEFDSAQALLDAAHKVRAAGYTKTDAFSPFPIHGLAEALGFHERKVPKIVLGGRHHGRARRLRPRVLDAGHRVSDEHRRPAVPLVGVVHSAGVRDDDSVRGVLGGHRHARAERPAAAVSPGVQRAAVQRWRARTSSSWPSRPPTRSSTLNATRAVPGGPQPARGGGS